mmetsp:Transcript_13376/g.20906  ORF Transcript_13376/g.20906 Transcript_13376/m.20906 type:complete len:94 (+) Transcript_13376:3613-3894(+)
MIVKALDVLSVESLAMTPKGPSPITTNQSPGPKLDFNKLAPKPFESILSQLLSAKDFKNKMKKAVFSNPVIQNIEYRLKELEMALEIVGQRLS